jgi:hypothetical protein
MVLTVFLDHGPAQAFIHTCSGDSDHDPEGGRGQPFDLNQW